MNKLIGIVGGMGSYAGIDLIKKVYDQTNASLDKDHLPVAMLSLPEIVPDRTEFILGKAQENPGTAIAKIITTLVNMGSDVVGIACNTAHAEPIFRCILENLKHIQQPFKLLNMIEEIALYISDSFPDVKKIGILSTSGVLYSGIYPQVMSNFNIEAIQVSDNIQRKFVSPAIYNTEFGIKAQSNPVSDKAKSHLFSAAAYLKNRGAQAIVLGCTEIPLAFSEKYIEKIPLIDSTGVLARALIRNTDPDKLLF